jgi:hypothetical protein
VDIHVTTIVRRALPSAQLLYSTSRHAPRQTPTNTQKHEWRKEVEGGSKAREKEKDKEKRISQGSKGGSEVSNSQSFEFPLIPFIPLSSHG